MWLYNPSRTAFVFRGIKDLLIDLTHSCSSEQDTFACLQAADPQVLETTNLNITISAFPGTFVTVPVVDGSFIIERPTLTLDKGRGNGVRIEITRHHTYYHCSPGLLRESSLMYDAIQELLHSVTNTFENRVFVSNSTTMGTLADYVTQLLPTFGAEQINAVVEAYTNIGLETTHDQAIGVLDECKCHFF